MEKIEPKSSEYKNLEAEKIQRDFERLKKIASILKEMGLRVIERSINPSYLRESMEMGGVAFPIVRDGIDGIRASYSKREGLKISFTNGFVDLDNLRRKREIIEQKLKEEGLLA